MCVFNVTISRTPVRHTCPYTVCGNSLPSSRHQAGAIGHGVKGVGFVEGDRRKPIGARILLALARVLEGLLLDLRRADSAVAPYTDVVLRCLTTLFLGEEGFLAVRVRCSQTSMIHHRGRLGSILLLAETRAGGI